ncbi:MAG: hypothetical protein RIR39_2572 [Pseudomonadota bacterium]|jgi:hypothetical protein
MLYNALLVRDMTCFCVLLLMSLLSDFLHNERKCCTHYGFERAANFCS